jgi:hypothetical protein
VQVLDASPEAVAIANEKVSDNVTWTIGNIFEHRTERRYDTVFFGFWPSHVPREPVRHLLGPSHRLPEAGWTGVLHRQRRP